MLIKDRFFFIFYYIDDTVNKDCPEPFHDLASSVTAADATKAGDYVREHVVVCCLLYDIPSIQRLTRYHRMPAFSRRERNNGIT